MYEAQKHKRDHEHHVGRRRQAQGPITTGRKARTLGTIANGFALLVSALLLSSCQGGFEPGNLRLPISRDPQLTGGLTPDGRPLTSASDDLEIQKLKERIDASNTDNLSLAQDILSVRLFRLNGQGAVVTSAPEKIKIEVILRVATAIDAKPVSSSTLSPQTLRLEFLSTLRHMNGVFGFPQALATNTKGYSLSLVCSDRDCNRASGRLRQRTQYDPQTGPTRDGEAGFVLRRRAVNLRAHLAKSTTNEGKASSTLVSLNHAIGDKSASRVQTSLETLEVAWGSARFNARLVSPDTTYCFSGLLVETNDSDELLGVSCDDQKSAPSSSLQAILVGNNNRGGLVVALIENGAILSLTLLPVEGMAPIASPPQDGTTPTNEIPNHTPNSEATEVTDPGDRTQTPKAPGDVSPPESNPPSARTPRIPSDPNHPVTRVWEADRGRADIQAGIRRWTTQELERTRQFLTRIQPNLPLLTKELAASQVPTEFLTLTMIESRYFVDEGYPVEVNEKSTAMGPWQFVAGTGRWLGLKVRPFLAGRRADPCDERAQLGPSTAAAGRYLRLLLDEFPSDPRLAVMSYYWGQGNVGETVECMQRESCLKRRLGAKAATRVTEIKNSGFDFWSVREFNMAPRDATEYVIRFVSGQFVVREPERHGIIAPDPIALGATRSAATTCK